MSLTTITELKVGFVFKINNLLGINASYDITTTIPKEKITSTKNYMLEYYDKIKTVFSLDIKFPEKLDNPSYNSFIFQVIKEIYKNFNGNIFGSYGKINKRKPNEVVFCFRGLDLDKIVKKCDVNETKDESLFKVKEDEIYNIKTVIKNKDYSNFPIKIPEMEVKSIDMETKNNNNTLSIYILQLEQNKYYVGKTYNISMRLEQHNISHGSSWTAMYKPIKIINIIPNCDDFDEDKYTLMCMKNYGIENVRGGSFCSIELDNCEIKIIEKMIKGATNKCYICGSDNHFAKECNNILNTPII